MPDSRWRAGAPDAGARLDRFLAHPDRLGSRGRAADAIGKGKVFVNGVEAAGPDASRRLAAGDDVRVWMDRPGSARTRTRAVRRGPLEILYEDAALVVVNKPPGVLTVPLARSPAESVQDLLAAGRRRRPRAVHRIDRDTSGVVVFAKTAPAQAALKNQFARREPEREYLAIVRGCPDPPAGTWRDRLAWDDRRLAQRVAPAEHPRAAVAVTHYRVIERFAGASLLEVRLETGKRNQIRVQAAVRGHALLGERQYADAQTAVPDGLRQALHAARIAFRHPVDGRPLAFSAPLPPDLQGLLEALRAS